MSDMGCADGYVYLNRGATKFPEDNRARTAALAQQGYARIAADNAAKAEAKAEKQAVRAAKKSPATLRKSAGDGESVRELLGEEKEGKGGRKRGLLGGFWKRGVGEGEGEVVR
ncbi:hypothetical protein MMC17_007290 [Xylographa soralifera]|nr:hypothetical protein [Xylographa soralifera]